MHLLAGLRAHVLRICLRLYLPLPANEQRKCVCGFLVFRRGLRIRRQKCNLGISQNQSIRTNAMHLILGNLDVSSSASYGVVVIIIIKFVFTNGVIRRVTYA